MANSANFALWSPDGGDRIDQIRTVLATMQTSVDTALTGITNNSPRAVANIAARDAMYPAPVQGNRVWNVQKLREETYFAAYNAASNPLGKTVAGWYQTGGVPFAVGRLEGVAQGGVISSSAPTGVGVVTIPGQSNMILDIGARIQIVGSVYTYASSNFAGQVILTTSTPTTTGRQTRRLHNHGRANIMHAGFSFELELPAGTYGSLNVAMSKDSASADYEIFDMQISSYIGSV